MLAVVQAQSSLGWFSGLLWGESVAQAVVVLGLVIASGMALGSVRVLGIGLGVAGVLFSGIFAGQIGLHINLDILEFAREFGLILFVYTIGLQVGPGFFSSLRRHGLRLNLMAAGIVLLGAGLAILISRAGHIRMEAAVGLFSGATTNTPSLAAAQQALRELITAHAPAPLTPEIQKQLDATVTLPGQAYAIAYPFGVIGIILAMLLIRAIFRINTRQENVDLRRQQGESFAQLASVNVEITNNNLTGRAIREIPALSEPEIVVSRLMRGGYMRVAQPQDIVLLGDVLLAVGPRDKLDDMLLMVGTPSELDLRSLPSDIVTRRVIVTRRRAVGRSIDELDFLDRYGVTVTRVLRAEVELAPTPQLKLQLGDRLQAVGESDAIDKVAAELGDSVKELDQPHLIPVFAGIVLGVIVGSIPIPLPGVPAGVKLGLAGGPLLVSIILSRIHRIGPLVWYLPVPANYALRESGILLFLACVGLKSGAGFLQTLLKGDGFYWMAMAAIITFVPIMAIGLIGRIFSRLNYLTICGVLAGSMTDPPALAYANTLAGPEAPSVAYATVYPLTMILRVICAQLMVLLFAG
jgi:putative transport protein